MRWEVGGGDTNQIQARATRCSSPLRVVMCTLVAFARRVRGELWTLTNESHLVGRWFVQMTEGLVGSHTWLSHPKHVGVRR